MTLLQFINTHYNGSKAAFAKDNGIIRQQVNNYMRRGNCHVIEIDGSFTLVNTTKTLATPENRSK